MQKVRDIEQQYAMPQAVQNYSASKLLQSCFKVASKQRKSSAKVALKQYQQDMLLWRCLGNCLKMRSMVV